MRYSAGTVNSLYRQVLTHLITHGERSAPRNLPTVESLAAHLTLTDPRFNILTVAGRKPNYQFMIAEFLWMMGGQNDVETIKRFNKNLIIARDSGMPTFAGAYGPKLVEQLPYVVDTLTKDPDSRQAVISIWQPRPRASKDIPCTISLQYLLRDGKVHAVTYMRSNDAWLGLPYDIFNFTMLQRQVAWRLKAEVGDYHHMVGSLHLYNDAITRAEMLVKLPNDQLGPMNMYTEGEHFVKINAAFLDLATAPWGASPKGDEYTWKQWEHRWGEDLSMYWHDMFAVLAQRFTVDSHLRDPHGVWAEVRGV